MQANADNVGIRVVTEFVCNAIPIAPASPSSSEASVNKPRNNPEPTSGNEVVPDPVNSDRT